MPQQDIAHAIAAQKAQGLADEHGLPLVKLVPSTISFDALGLISRNLAEAARVIPYAKNSQEIWVAVQDPIMAQGALKKLEQLEKTLHVGVALPSDISAALVLYDAEVLQKKQVSTTNTYNEELSHEALFSQLKSKIEATPVTEGWSTLRVGAVAVGASDLHMQPSKDGAVVRFRIDGMMVDGFIISPKKAHQMRTHIKFSSGLKSNITDIPQDGAQAFEANGRPIEMRISTVPTREGESIVCRILDTYRGILPYKKLGFAPHTIDAFRRALGHSEGLILMTGPTGSGKTTTLYSMLAELDSSTRKIVTLEDPVEYRLPRAVQSQVSEGSDYTFETGLKALLRHDPDVILVGEIRTPATARLAIEAAMTGHMVLSSLHTNSALGAITRLRHLGVDDAHLASVLRAVFAQRLVRRVDKKEAKSIPTELPKELKSFQETYTKKEFGAIPKTILRAENENAYRGRVAVAEHLLCTDEVSEMIFAGKSEGQMRAALDAETMVPLWLDGLWKVFAGDTTLEEMSRVLGQPD